MGQDWSLPHVQVYTDGGCDPNPGPGGWAALLRFEGREWVLQGNDPDTTNNRMELQAALSALAILDRLLGACHVEIYTDSQYLQQGITEWMENWLRNGWQTRNKEPVKNQDLWMALQDLTEAHEIEWNWLEGHAGHPENERADRLVAQARQLLRPAAGQARSQPLAPMAERSQSPAPAPERGPAAAPPSGNLPAVEMCVVVGGSSPMGWAVVLRMGDNTRLLKGAVPSVSANAMLIRAAAEGLQALTRPCRVTVYSSAEYLVKGASQWIKGWQARDWQTKDGKPVANRADWEKLLEASARHRVTWQAVTEDSAPPDIERAAQLAAEAIEEMAGQASDDYS